MFLISRTTRDELVQAEVVEIQQVFVLLLKRAEEFIQHPQGMTAKIAQRGMKVDGVHRNNGRNATLETCHRLLHTVAHVIAGGIQRRLDLYGAIGVEEARFIDVGRQPPTRSVLRDANSAGRPGLSRVIIRSIPRRTRGQGAKPEQLPKRLHGFLHEKQLSFSAKKTVPVPAIPVFETDPGHPPINVRRMRAQQAPQEFAVRTVLTQSQLQGSAVCMRDSVQSRIKNSFGNSLLVFVQKA